MWLRETRVILALVLLSGLNGCLHAVATPEERRTGIDLVGSAESSASIRVGVSTREEVVQSLGDPKEVSSDGRAIAYSFNPIVSRSGFVFFGGPCGLCGYYPFEDRTKEELWLAFNQDDTLKSYASSREKREADWKAFCAAASSPP